MMRITLFKNFITSSHQMMMNQVHISAMNTVIIGVITKDEVKEVITRRAEESTTIRKCGELDVKAIKFGKL